MKRFLIISALSIAVAFTACKNDQSSSVTKFSVKMTDAPGAYQSIMLNVKEIQVMTSEGTTTMPVGDEPFDVLDFRLGKDTLLASEDIAAGQLQEVRLVLHDCRMLLKKCGIHQCAGYGLRNSPDYRL